MPETHVLSIDAVKWGISALAKRRVHPHFLGYLQLRRRFVLTSTDPLEPQWSDLKPLITMPGGPPKRPFYRPLWTTIDNKGSVYWLNPNLAGSFAIKSIRSTASFLVDNDQFVLSDDHVERARDAFLYEQPVSAVAMGAYFLRNFGFSFDGPPTADRIISGVREWFAFTDEHQADFEYLFDLSVPEVTFDWFEEAAVGEERND